MATSTQTAVTRRIDRLLAEYGESHQHPVNKAIHWVMVPLITWTVLALLCALPVPQVFSAVPFLNWATLFAAFACVYYATLSLPLTAAMVVLAALLFGLVALCQAFVPLPLWQVALGVFAAAWVFQFIGHAIEGKRPSFFKDVQFLLVGPAWLMHFLFRKAGIPY